MAGWIVIVYITISCLTILPLAKFFLEVVCGDRKELYPFDRGMSLVMGTLCSMAWPIMGVMFGLWWIGSKSKFLTTGAERAEKKENELKERERKIRAAERMIAEFDAKYGQKEEV